MILITNAMDCTSAHTFHSNTPADMIPITLESLSNRNKIVFSRIQAS